MDLWCMYVVDGGGGGVGAGRYEDAINSVKSAIEMGVLPGGGSQAPPHHPLMA